jgi:lipoprotein-releasing system permease protein
LNFPFYIAKRYLKSANKNNAINIINGIASLGIIVSSMVLFVVLSIFSGLVNFSLSFSNDFDPDLKITSTLGKSYTFSTTQEQKIQAIEGVASFSKVVEERALFMFDGKEQFSYLKGVDATFTKVSNVKKSLFNGQWLSPNTSQVVIGYGISQKLSLGIFDFNNPFEVFAPKPGKGTIENPDDAFVKIGLIPVGIYAVSEDLDSKYVFADIDVARELLGFQPNQITTLELKLKPNADENKVKEQLQILFNNKITIKNRAQLNDALYKMLNTENTAIYLLFTLVIILTLFTLAGAIIMMILDKRGNLKTLYNLGTEVKDLRKIFLLQGTLLSVFGGLFGLSIGVVLVLIQQQFEVIMITPSLAYPVDFLFKNVVIVLGTIITLGFIASLIASSRVSKKLLE